MPALNIELNGEGILEGYPREMIVACDNTEPITVAALPGGMASGDPSVSFIFNLPDGRKVFAETSMKLFFSAAVAFRARYGNLGTTL